jgi:transcription elongation factor Elf1
MSTSQNNSILVNPYICPICNETPEIVDVLAETGKIIINCNCGQNKEWDVFEFLQKLEQTGKISPNSYKRQSNQSSNDNSEDNIILENAKNISDIIRINQLIDLTQRKYPNNYYHNISLINLGKSIEEENKTPTNINETVNEILKSERSTNEEVEAIKQLKSYKTYIDNKVEKLIIKGEKTSNDKYPWLKNEGFELISKIKFKHLIELNLASNGISSVSYLDNMLLPHLKYLNLSQNSITEIKPVAELLSEHMREILLHENKIKDIGDFKKSNFNELELLRVDKNNINIKSKNFIEVQKKYGKRLQYKSIDFKEFNNKYDCKIDESSKVLDLSSKRKGDIILIDFYSIINSTNKIISLTLDDNKLQNVSILNRIPLYHLTILDLSLNQITDIKFLKKLSKKCKLQHLFLHDNKIMDISPLINYSDEKDLIFEDLKLLSLKRNNFVKYDNSEEFHFINKEALQISINLAEKLKEGFDFDLKKLEEEKRRLIRNNEGNLGRIDGNANDDNNENNIMNENN